MAVKFRDYYEALGIPRTASQDDIKRAYRKLARKHHPDVNPGDRQAEERFKEINEANAVLSDPEKRKRYDQLGPDWEARANSAPRGAGPGADFGGFEETFVGGGQGAGFSDFFESLFGRGARRRGGSAAGFAMRGQDVEAELPVSLEEAHRGGKRTLTVQAVEPCPTCHGTGETSGAPCKTCRGAGQVRRPRTLEVDIPAGVREGTVIRLAGQGEPGLGPGPPGDLFLRVRLSPHPRFVPTGDADVEIELPVAPWEAVLGARLAVPTLDGPVEMTIPAGAQGGQRLRLRGQGMKRRTGGRGDQYVKLKVVVPTAPTAEEKELFQKLAATSRFRPREGEGRGRP